jgi:hypothetical protein
MRLPVPVLLSIAIAVAGTVGLVLVAFATDAGIAPDNGQQTFDAPGCLPRAYAGPAHQGHYMLNRNCPTPTPVILRNVFRDGGTWRVSLDGSRSFDPMGGRLVGFAWSFDGGPRRYGRRVSVHVRRPGAHTVALLVTNDSGLTGAELQNLVLR